MKTLIIHIGAPKCGSSSIQEFFLTNKSPCVEHIKFIKLCQQKLNKFKSDSEHVNNYLTNIINDELKLTNFLILSGEMLFLKPLIIIKICAIASDKVDRIKIIGYSRKSSDYVVSAYHQWGYFIKKLDNVFKYILLRNAVNPIYFYGFERTLISIILLNYQHIALTSTTLIHWEKDYNTINEIAKKFNAELKVGLLPNKKSTKTLLEDFCSKTNLTLKKGYLNKQIVSNAKFNPYLIESLNSSLNYEFINPDLFTNSQTIYKLNSCFKQSNLNSKFSNKLKEHIDAHFYESNMKFCEMFGLDKSYFVSKKGNSREEIIEIIKQEMLNRRASNEILNKNKEINATIIQALFSYYKRTKDDKFIPIKKLKEIKLLWHKTPEPIRKIGQFLKKNYFFSNLICLLLLSIN